MVSNIVDRIISGTEPHLLGGLARGMPRPILDRIQNDSFRRIVRYASIHSPFYRKKFSEFKIDPFKVKKPEDLGDFYTVPADIIENAEEFLCRKPQMAFESSGTTGRNKRVYFSHDELDRIGRFNAAGLFLGGVTTDDRIVNGFDFSIWIPGMIAHKAMEWSGLLGMAAGKIDPMEVYKRIPVYNFNIVMGEPTWLIKLTEIAEKHGSHPLKLIIGGAEEMPEAARPWMEKVWQGAGVRMVYASVESGGIMGFEPFSACGAYHIDENSFLIEIIDPDSEGYGEVAFTTLFRRTMPLIRYRNRDVSRIVEDKCQCGLPYKRLARMKGRTDELVVASGGNLYPLMFQEILKDVAGITSEWQVVFRLRGIKEVMELNLESKGERPPEAIKENVFTNMRSRYPDLWKNLSLGIFETEFVYHAPGTLRTGRKLLRLVDKRYDKR
jgi:phenylacetate-CoA ligase